MSKQPVEQLQSETGIEKKDDETVHEYVERVGEEGEISPEIIEDALTYITEWHYSDAPPEDDSALQTLLRQIGDSESDAPESQTDTDISNNSDANRSRVNASGGGSVIDGQRHSSPDGPAQTVGNVSEEVDEDGEHVETETIGLSANSEVEQADQSGFKSGIRGKKPRKLLLRFVAIVVTAPVIGWMIARAWVPGNQLYDQGQSILTEILGLSGAAAVDLIAVFGLGLYFSLLVLFISDVKKRVQGVLLLLGTGLAVTTVWVLGVFFPALELTTLNVLSLVLGVFAGLVLEAGQLFAIDFSKSTFQRPTLDTGDVPEFRHAAQLLFGLVSVVVIATFIQVLLAGVVQVFDLFAAGIFLVLLYQFVQYDSETNYMTLGPERSGKSMLLLGLSLELLQNSETYPNPNTYLQQGLERASNLEPGAEEWPIPSTAHDEVRAGSFEVISGYYFPLRLQLTALDYAGQHLGRVAELLSSDRGETDETGVAQQVADSVAASDTLFFILDVERLVYPDEFQEAGVTEQENVSWGLEHYSTILNHIDPEDIIVIATKCDILVDSGRVDPVSSHESFAEFRDEVTEHLLSRPDVRDLLETTGASIIQPVYFATKKRGGEYVPALDETENLVPVGYDYLIDEIRSRQ